MTPEIVSSPAPLEPGAAAGLDRAAARSAFAAASGPFTLRHRLIEEIRAVANAAREGRKARIRIKVNGLTHTEVIDELYAASEAGARIELIVRGMCSLRPDGQWERMKAKKDERVRSAQATMMRRARRRVSLARAAR